MVGTASNFLTYNSDSVMMHLLAIEDHLRHLDPAYRSEDSSCLVKHALQLREQSLEGISHATAEADREKVAVFRDLERGAEHLRDLFKRRTSPDTLILEVRTLRKRAETLDPTFNLEKCRSCGNAEQFLEELGAENEKGLYSPSAQHSHRSNKSDQNMTAAIHRSNKSNQNMKAAMKEVATVVGGVNIGWGIGYTAKAYIDPMAPGAIMGQNPSLLIDVGGTLAAIIGALKLKGATAKKLATYIAAGLSTYIWDDLAKLLAPTPAVAGSYATSNARGYPTVGVGAVGTAIPAVPGYPYPAQRLAEYPFASPVSVGATMSPPHYTLNGVPGLKNVVLGPKYTLDGM